MNRKIIWLITGCLMGVLLLASCGPGPEDAPGVKKTPGPEEPGSEMAPSGPEKEPRTEAMEEEREVKVTEDGVRYIVDPEKLVSGGPPKDGIPSIDSPRFIPLEEADQWIEDDELVLAMDYRGTKRVYPLQILVWHEIVNDVIAGDPLLITY